MMALESVSVAETVIQSNDDNDLEDGEIPSDEDDDQQVMVIEENHKNEAAPPPSEKIEPVKKTFDNKFKAESEEKPKNDNNRKATGFSSEDWASDVEKAIRAALDEDNRKDNVKPKGKNNKNRNRKRNRDDREEDRKDQKKKKAIDEVNATEDDDEMLFVRGASPSRKDSRERDIPSPKRDHENYHSGSDYDDRPGPNRHREEKRSTRWTTKQAGLDRNKKISAAASRRNNAKNNDRPGKNKGGRQMRNERNNRRNQGNDHNQDPDAICVYYMQGKCHRGDDCPYSHDALPPRKMELCKFYLMDCCAKRDKCLYMHHDFPCKFFHTGSHCSSGENCKFSHEPMSEQVKNILLKHLETAPKEILGNFPRLSREGALSLINNTEKSLLQGISGTNQKIPSLFELKVPTPPNTMPNEPMKEEGDDHSSNRDRSHKDRKKTRWGANDDRVPIDLVLQSANKLGLQLGQDKPQDKPVVNFYGEGGPNDVKVEKEEPVNKNQASLQDPMLKEMQKDVDFRQLLGAKAPSGSVVNLADEAAKLSKSKIDDESDRDEDASLIIEMSTDDEDRHAKKTMDALANMSNKNSSSPNPSSQDVPTNLPKKTQELYMRIQQQQREAEDSYKNLENNEDQEINQDDWYSDDNSDDDDDDDQLTIVDVQREEEKEKEEEKEIKMEEEEPLQPSLIPQPAPITNTLRTLSKIDISAEVSTLLSSLKARASSNVKQEKEVAPKMMKKESDHTDVPKNNLSDMIAQYSKMETADDTQPGSSPNRTTGASTPSQATAVSRDPRMSRDPRQRRDEQRQSSVSSNSSSNSIPPATKPNESPRDSRTLRQEMSIYSSGIIATDSDVSHGRTVKPDQDHRRKDMDLRCFPPGPSFGDTDLRMVGGHYPEASKSGDVDLRQMLGLPFKPVPSHVPCTEIEASISSHPPIPFKLYTIDIPRPDYTGLKLTKNDPQVRYDPRLRKIFRLPKDDIADSPMSPPPVKMLDTPKSPPMVRADPRRKALEANPPKIIPTTVQQHMIQDHTNMPGMSMGMTPGYMQGSVSMQGSGNVQGPGMMQNMGPQPLMMQNPMNSQSMMMRDPMRDSMLDPMRDSMREPMRDSMREPMRDSMREPMREPMMGGNGTGINQDNMRMRNMGPPGSNHMQQHSGSNQHQMNQYDPRYNAPRGASVGLLGVAPQNMGGYSQDMRGQYDGPPSRYQNEGYGNYGNPNHDRGDPRSMYNHNGPMDDQQNYSNKKSDWNNMNQGRPNRKERRRPLRGKFGMSRKKDLS